MKATGREVVDVIETIVQLDWFRYVRVDSDHTPVSVPVTVWRFKSADAADQPGNRVIQALRFVLDGLSSSVPWSLTFSGRNWVLSPRQVQELEDSGRFKTDGELLQHLRTEFPELGQRASDDLVKIANGLARQLQIGS
jgi:hypothetical protein